MDQDNYLQIAKKAILAPQEFILKNFGKDLKPEIVDDHDLKIPVDKKVEKVIIDVIKREFPEHGFDSEEFGKDGSEKEFVWYIDPLDGTNNYVPGIPYFGSSIALVHKHECIISMIHNPFLKKTYHAIKGFGAYLNDEKLVCQNNKNDLRKATMSFIRGHRSITDPKLKKEGDELEMFVERKFRRVLKMWCPVLDWGLLAEGRIDAAISFEDEPQEEFAGTLLAQEAGLEVYNFDGSRYNGSDHKVIACNSFLLKDLCSLVSK